MTNVLLLIGKLLVMEADRSEGSEPDWDDFDGLTDD